MTDQELNEAVAQKLKGWFSKCKCEFPLENAHHNCPAEFGTCHHADNCNLPDFCHSIAAAWELWDHFHEMATLTKHEEKWILDYGRRFKIEADTAPRAICLAFLKLGLDKPAKQE